MRAISVTSLIFIFLLGISLINAQQIELKNDDGSDPNLSLNFSYFNKHSFISRMSPPETPARLEKIRYYISDISRGDLFNLVIYDNAGEMPSIVLYGPVLQQASANGWNEIDLSANPVMLSGDFYISFEQIQDSEIALGAENRIPLSNRTYDGDLCDWWIVDDLDLMLMATVSFGITSIRLKPSQIEKEQSVSLNSFPNPFNNRTTISFQLNSAGEISVKIFDITGKLIQTLYNGRKPAGVHQFAWSGKNNRGDDLPGGVYFAQLSGRGLGKVIKIFHTR